MGNKKFEPIKINNEDFIFVDLNKVSAYGNYSDEDLRFIVVDGQKFYVTESLQALTLIIEGK